jgi:hypothetical protein
MATKAFGRPLDVFWFSVLCQSTPLPLRNMPIFLSLFLFTQFVVVLHSLYHKFSTESWGQILELAFRCGLPEFREKGTLIERYHVFYKTSLLRTLVYWIFVFKKRPELIVARWIWRSNRLKLAFRSPPKLRLLNLHLMIELCRYFQGWWEGVLLIQLYIYREESRCKALPQPYIGFKTRFDNSMTLSLCPQPKIPLTKFKISFSKIH